MAGSASSAVGSPPSNESHNPVQDWELLSASALLAQGHGLGFALPPLTTTPVLQASRVEVEGVPRGFDESDVSASFIFRGKDGGSVPLDVSQIAALSNSSSSSVEPFTEGWKPQFRIAGAPLQENYYASDPFAPAASDNNGPLEPFLNMEHDFAPASSRTANVGTSKSSRTNRKPIFRRVNSSERGVKQTVPSDQQEKSKDEFYTQEEGIEAYLENPDKLDLNKSSVQNGYVQESIQILRKSQGFLSRKPYVTWSIAITTVLLGVFFITYCTRRDNANLVQELSSQDEVIQKHG